MRGTEEKDVPDAVTSIPDPRARHFWDGAGEVMHLYAPVLGIKEGLPAWDVYLLYGPGERWEAGQPPPPPRYWMHQLRHQQYQPMPGQLLDSALFSDELARIARGS